MSMLNDIKQGLRIPVIGAPLYIVSNPTMVIEQCKAGIIGSFPALNARPKNTLKSWITEIKHALDAHKQANPGCSVAPFAVNQICHQTNTRLQHDMEICVEQQVPIIITSLRPPADVIKAVHGYGGMVMHDVVSIRHAEKALEQGVDGLIAVTSGAGGHAGQINPFALITEIREIFDGPLALSGSISTGDGILAARALGADFAYMGTRFIASKESSASEDYKQMIMDCSAKDIVYTPAFTGVPANYMAPSITDNGIDLADLAGINPGSLDLTNDEASFEDDTKPKAWLDIWSAGHGVGTIHNAPSIADIVNQLEKEYNRAREQI